MESEIKLREKQLLLTNANVVLKFFLFLVIFEPRCSYLKSLFLFLKMCVDLTYFYSII